MTTAAIHPFTGSFIADPDHSSFQAQLRHMGVGSFRTGFDDVEARLEDGPEGPRLTGRARVGSITIRRPREFRAHVVEGAEFFDARNHPEITFASRRLQFSDDGTVALDGLLTMRGIERPITATGTYLGPIEDIYGGRRAALDLEAEIDRRDWGMDLPGPAPARRRRALVDRQGVGPPRAGRRRGLTVLVLGISGSLRASSFNTALLRAAAGLLPPAARMPLYTGLALLPPYSEALDVEPAPPPVKRLRAGIQTADALLIATPEYNASIPGQLKNALDWASRPYPDNALRQKPVAVVGASTGVFGAVWAQAELRKVLTAAGAHVLDDELPIGSAYEAFDDDRTLADRELRTRLEHILLNLARAAVP